MKTTPNPLAPAHSRRPFRWGRLWEICRSLASVGLGSAAAVAERQRGTMGLATRVALVAGPLLAVPAVTSVYTYLNIDRRLFVKHLGCGCAPFFNTNHLNLSICLLLLVGTGASWWIASRGVGWRWRMLGAAGFIGWSLVFCRAFMFHNGWA